MQTRPLTMLGSGSDLYPAGEEAEFVGRQLGKFRACILAPCLRHGKCLAPNTYTVYPGEITLVIGKVGDARPGSHHLIWLASHPVPI